MVAPTQSQIAVPITGMTCAACVVHVENALEEVGGVGRVSVNLATEKASLDLDSNRVELADLTRAVEEAGYGIGTRKTTLAIGGMTCAACVVHVENALCASDGVLSAQVNLATERASVEYVPGVAGISALRHSVEDAGYSVAAVVGDPNDDAATPKDVRTLRNRMIFSLAVAALIMASDGHSERRRPVTVQNGLRAARSRYASAVLGRTRILHVRVERCPTSDV